MNGSSNNAIFLEAEVFDCAPLMVHASMQAERDAVVEQVTTSNLHALELSMANQELQS